MYDLQRASMWKRMSAWLFDFIIFAIIAVGCVLVFAKIIRYDDKLENYKAHYTRYAEEFGIDLEISKEDYEALSDDMKLRYDVAEELFSKDAEVYRDYSILFALTILSVSIGILLSFLIWEFMIPLILGNGQTLGKKFFGVGVMRVDGVKVTPVIMFIRTVLGKFAVETMIPIYIIIQLLLGSAGIISIALLILIPIFQLIMYFTSRTGSMIHDALSQTVTVDLASQMIFDTKEDLLAYKKKVHKEIVDSADYK